MNRRRWLAPIAWTVVILVLTSLPGSRIPSVAVPGVDKIVHFVLYGVLGLLIARALDRRGVARAALLAILIGASFGAVDEWHQRFIAGRSPSAADWAADVAGAAVGSIALLVRGRREYPA